MPELSYWAASAAPQKYYAPLNRYIEADVAVIGGGIAGLNAAYLLKKAGLSVAVLEKNTIGSGTTGGTTGKVTVQHGIIYDELIKRWGVKNARAYAKSAQAAFDEMKKIIRSERIHCDWQTRDNYVYTARQDTIARLKQEARAAARLGLPASYATRLSLPFDTLGAVKFANQASFHSGKYIQGLAKFIHGNNSYVFEQSQATSIKDSDPCIVDTASGSVKAKSIIVATKIPPAPLVGRITYGALEHPETSYIVAGKYDGNLRGMYISPDKNHYSLLPIKSSHGPLLLIGGQNHTPGLGLPERRYGKLTDYAKHRFGISHTPYRWKAMDYIAYDNIPIAGLLYPWSKNMYVISGLKKWGLNLSMVCSMLVRDQILRKENSLEHFFRPSRLSAPASIPRTIADYLR
jgi:glycine/D-amino acid oxidase-like deaminating enzyme